MFHPCSIGPGDQFLSDTQAVGVAGTYALSGLSPAEFTALTKK